MNEISASKQPTPVLFLDLDGTVRKGFDELGRWVNGPEDVELFDGMADLLWSYKQAGWRIVGVTNQGGVALGHVTTEKVLQALSKTQWLTHSAFDSIAYCVHHPAGPDGDCLCRKPKIGMLVKEITRLEAWHQFESYPTRLMLMVGDRPEDKQCAENAGIAFMDAAEWRAKGPVKA